MTYFVLIFIGWIIIILTKRNFNSYERANGIKGKLRITAKRL